MPDNTEANVDLAPIWLSKHYIEDKLQKLYQDPALEVKQVLIKPAVEKGDNLISVMTRIQVDFLRSSNRDNLQRGSYLVKLSFQEDELCANTTNQYKVFEHEMEIYERISPKLIQLLADIGEQDKLFANTIHVDQEHASIILEDLSTLYYVTADRSLCLDKTHANLALRKLAQMHATAAVLNERNPGIFKNFDYGIFNRHTRAFEPYFTAMFEECVQVVEKADENLCCYAPKLRALKQHVMEYTERVYEPTEGFFNTLTHGDFWTSNIMFKYDNEKVPVNVILIDFQFSCWASPAVDLHYFFNTSLQEELRLHKQDELVDNYYNVLSKTLRKLKFMGVIPTLKEFHQQFHAKAFLAVTSSLCSQPNMINTNNEDSDFRAVIESNERGSRYKRMLYENEKVQHNVQTLLPIFDKKGLLDLQTR